MAEKTLTGTERLRYRCYESAVQDPERMLGDLTAQYRAVFNRDPLVFREDFCGTFLYASEWVKGAPNRRAIGIDLGDSPLAYGRLTHLPKLPPHTRSRLTIEQRNVLDCDNLHADLIAASNFSFYVLKTRAALEAYARSAYTALHDEGLFVLELAGGPEFEESPYTERRTVHHHRGRNAGQPWFTYSWNHRSFNPITREGIYTISFAFPDGTRWKDSFVYDWRVWTIPEVRESLLTAGFDDAIVFWEDVSEKGKELGTYSPQTTVENHPTWICYVAGVKRG